MANPYRGEVEILINGKPRVMRLTLGVLAELEEQLECQSLVDLVARFEAGTFRAKDIVTLIRAGLRGGGCAVEDPDLQDMRIDGGLYAAARAAARLLKVTFAVPGEATE